MAKKADIFFLLFCLVIILPGMLAKFGSFLDTKITDNVAVSMHKQDQKVVPHTLRKRAVMNLLHDRQRRSTDSECASREAKFKASLSAKGDEFRHQHTFANETKTSVSLVWAGERKGDDDGRILVAVAEEQDYYFMHVALPSSLYLSTDDGKTFTDITTKLSNDEIMIKKANGLQKNPADVSRVYVLTHSSDRDTTGMFFTTDGGGTFTSVTIPFLLEGELVFHPLKKEYILAIEDSSRDLYFTSDSGVTWKLIQSKVISFKWSNSEADMIDYYTTVYLTMDPYLDISDPISPVSNKNTLMKTENLGGTWKDLLTEVYTFGIQGKFLFASVHKPDNDEERLMKVSTDSGDSWNEAQLPSITEDRFYSILDMSEELIFIHVDQPGNNGRGTLYTSDSTGIIFSESLHDHLYPNDVTDLTDFYKVQSMRGVYLASQLADDDSIHTVISYDRGAEWVPVERPIGVPCKDETKGCYLQIHNMYSLTSGVRAKPPLSSPSAVGIILVHGHVADSLQRTDPDVFISSDGGYSWRLALKGPHHYEIADQGGLLVAVPADEDYPNIIRFSTDEGHCWHEYTFTDEHQFHFTRMLTEPGNKEMSVAIWGYGEDDRVWRSIVLDFKKIIDRQCLAADYNTWTAHYESKKKVDGCLLGTKETFQRLKPESWCYNGHAKELSNSQKQTCECTKADYDCDYGYYRNVGSSDCERDPAFSGPEIDICLRGHRERLIQVGYRKIPGDLCQNGFVPAADKEVDLAKLCTEGDKTIVEVSMGIHKPLSSNKRAKAAILACVAIVGMLTVLVLIAYLVRRYRIMRNGVATFRYSLLKTDDRKEEDYENALAVHTSLYEDSSDEEQSQSSAARANGIMAPPKPAASSHTVPVPAPAVPHQPKVKAYHDDSDDDMLE